MCITIIVYTEKKKKKKFSNTTNFITKIKTTCDDTKKQLALKLAADSFQEAFVNHTISTMQQQQTEQHNNHNIP